MKSPGLLVFAGGIESFQGFLGGAGFRPSTVGQVDLAAEGSPKI